MMPGECPVCESSYATSTREANQHDIASWDCAVCGVFRLTDSAHAVLQDRRPVDCRVSAWIRDHEECKRDAPLISSDILKGIPQSLPRFSPAQKQTLLLRAIERRTKYPGFSVGLNQDTEYPLAWASHGQELTYLLRELEARKFITRRGAEDGGDGFVITTPGWEYLDAHASGPAFLDRAFVAMSFSEVLRSAWEAGIKPAVEKAGYKPYRIDEEPHIDRIDAKIIAEIRDSRFLIADVTEQRAGVYFEAGFALGLGRPVIWSVWKDDLESVHFDTRQYQHVVWETPDQLKERLYWLICSVIGEGSKGEKKL